MDVDFGIMEWIVRIKQSKWAMCFFQRPRWYCSKIMAKVIFLDNDSQRSHAHVHDTTKLLGHSIKAISSTIWCQNLVPFRQAVTEIWPKNQKPMLGHVELKVIRQGQIFFYQTCVHISLSSKKNLMKKVLPVSREPCAQWKGRIIIIIIHNRSKLNIDPHRIWWSITRHTTVTGDCKQ